MAAIISPTRSIGSRSKEQWSEISLADDFSLSNPYQPIFSLSTPTSDNIHGLRAISVSVSSAQQQVGSGSRSQWTTFEQHQKEEMTGTSSATELDFVLRDNNVPAMSLGPTKSRQPFAVPSTSDGDDDDDEIFDGIDMASVASYDHSEGEATAVTGNVSAMSIPMSMSAAQVTPENTQRGIGRSRSSDSSHRGGDRHERQIARSRYESPEPRRLAMCGAVAVNAEIKGAFQDVNDTVRQILTTVRKLGPDERAAVRETFKEVQYFMEEKVRSVLLPCKDDDNSRSLHREQRTDASHNVPFPRRRSSASREGRHRERVLREKLEKARADESARVANDRKEASKRVMLV